MYFPVVALVVCRVHNWIRRETGFGFVTVSVCGTVSWRGCFV